ncbi:MAG: cystathionine gamma-synthase [Gammaproteobacteria bacterium]|nr:MAG: cystathionine gamma-synthase [Pseudomonadota bacterium]MBC6943988.1 cystathionine gamma-synthase [Gammaproteobacteria bacterium]MCE7895208.1 cystathionine gamma-synthase [Gammaproteobacteria bacterium PRO8]MDL1880306.1 cystathionine gamma-synthase [Gammaproteobacteria bacterium PRO2]MCQ3934116.1 cystathionine gamma-synthase [Gammaproteobacteria bacterium]
MTDDLHPETRSVRAAIDSDEQFGAVMPPIVLSTNFAFAGFGQPRQYDYTRTANPTRDALATAIAELEGGAGATVTASGMAAITLACQLLNPGDLVLAPVDCYGGTFRLLSRLAARGLFRLRFIDLADAAQLAAAEGEPARLLWVETPTNPLLRIMDLARLRQVADACGALLAVDNTFLSPALQRPLEFGADLVVHSTTKYLNGHSDVVSGAVVARSAALHGELAAWANALGLTGAPFDSFLALRGLRTLFVRMRQHEANAMALAEALLASPAVAQVYYPGLPGHRGHDLARRQQHGFGGMLSFELRGGQEAARRFLGQLRLFTLAESLGGVESLACHPATMTHVPLGPEGRKAAGIGDGLVRLSAGIEATADLVADVRAALASLG